jgi:hypothetical protein
LAGADASTPVAFATVSATPCSPSHDRQADLLAGSCNHGDLVGKPEAHEQSAYAITANHDRGRMAASETISSGPRSGF